MQLSLLIFIAGCAFLRYKTREAALAAIKTLNDSMKMEVRLNSFN